MKNQAKQVEKERRKPRMKRKNNVAVGILVTCVGNQIRAKTKYTCRKRGGVVRDEMGRNVEKQ